MTVRITLTW